MTVEDMVDEYLIACTAFDVAIERVNALIAQMPDQ